MREDKLKEKEKFMSMMLAIKQEDELKERLRKENMMSTKSQLDKQIQRKKEIDRDYEVKYHKSFASSNDEDTPAFLEKDPTFAQESNPPQKRYTLALISKS
jgi:hypothetical protein